MSAAGKKFDLLDSHAVVCGLPWSFSFKRLAGPAKAPVDLSGCTCELRIIDALDQARLVAVTATLGGVLGTATFSLSEQQTRLIGQFGAARYRVFFTDAAGTRQLLLRGKIAVVLDD